MSPNLLGALGIGALVLVMVVLGRFALRRQHEAGVSEGKAETSAEQFSILAERVEKAEAGEIEAASAVSGLPDEAVTELVTKPAPRKKKP